MLTIDDLDERLFEVCSKEDLQNLIDNKYKLCNIKCINCGNIEPSRSHVFESYIDKTTGKIFDDKILYCKKCSKLMVCNTPEFKSKMSKLSKARFDSLSKEEIESKLVNFRDGCKKFHSNIPKEYRETMSKVKKEYWDNLSEEEKELFSDKCKESAIKYWENKSEEERKSYIINCIGENDYQKHMQSEENRFRLRNYVKENPDCIQIHRTSTFELEISDFINSLGLITELHKRKYLNGKELDIYIPSKNVAIECNGLYWHSDSVLPEQANYLKYQQCKSKGIHLIQITDEQWYNNQDKIKHYLSDLLTDNSIKVYARNCIIKQVDPSIAKEFYEQYHLQGCKVYYSINYGLYCNEELISCMSFGKSRIMNTTNPEGYYELHRYCVKSKYQIIGGASKLYKYFEKIHNPIEVKSFSDNDYFSGGIYERLGFTNEGYVRVYYWFNSKEYLPREKCQLQYLKDIFPETYEEANRLKELNEIGNREEYIMTTNGYHRYTTAGRTKWIKRYN